MKYLARYFIIISVVLSILCSPIVAYADLNSDLLDAAKKGATAAVEALLAKGADVNAKNEDEETALLIAEFGGYADIVNILVNKGADVNAKYKYGRTVLMFAVANGHTEIVKALLDKGSDVNVKNDAGITALMIAASNSYTEIVKILLNNKDIDVNANDNDGFTALAYATEKGATKIVGLLKKAGAKKEKQKGTKIEGDSVTLKPKENEASELEWVEVNTQGDWNCCEYYMWAKDQKLCWSSKSPSANERYLIVSIRKAKGPQNKNGMTVIDNEKAIVTCIRDSDHCLSVNNHELLAPKNWYVACFL